MAHLVSLRLQRLTIAEALMMGLDIPPVEGNYLHMLWQETAKRCSGIIIFNPYQACNSSRNLTVGEGYNIR